MDKPAARSELDAILEDEKKLSRRDIFRFGALGIASLPAITSLQALAIVPQRIPQAIPHHLPDIQFDLSKFIAPAQTIDGVLFRFGPVHTCFTTVQLTRTPTLHDQAVLREMLDTLENVYPFSPSGVFTLVSYGLPYFNRLSSAVVQSHMPRLLSDNTTAVLEEARPGPTDVSSGNPTIHKKTFNVPVVIEGNDLLFTFRSDHLTNLVDVNAWFAGSNRLHGKHIPSPRFNGLLTVTSQRFMFGQRGLPRQIADAQQLPYAGRINADSVMWMGFADQQVDGSGPAEIVTFQGNTSAKFTTAVQGDYFFDGAVQPLSHIILDLAQWYGDDMPYTERAQLMFRSTPIPSTGNTDQFTNGGGPTFLDNPFQGAGDAEAGAKGGAGTFDGVPRLGHLTALQRVSRAADGTPLHIRIDGPGFDAMDVPDASQQPKLQFSAFLPAAAVARAVRRAAASLDLAQQYGVTDAHNGVERFSTATRRQNFLAPPRSHRAFPLLEVH